jgi:hypothetical protein
VENELMASGTRSCSRESTTSLSGPPSRSTASRISQPWLFDGIVSYRVDIPAARSSASIHSSDWSNCGLPATRHNGAMRRTSAMAAPESMRGDKAPKIASARGGSTRSSGGRCGGTCPACTTADAIITVRIAARMT